MSVARGYTGGLPGASLARVYIVGVRGAGVLRGHPGVIYAFDSGWSFNAVDMGTVRPPLAICLQQAIGGALRLDRSCSLLLGARDCATGGAADLSGRQNQHKDDDEHQHVGIVADFSNGVYQLYDPPGPDPLFGEGCSMS